MLAPHSTGARRRQPQKTCLAEGAGSPQPRGSTAPLAGVFAWPLRPWKAHNCSSLCCISCHFRGCFGCVCNTSIYFLFPFLLFHRLLIFRLLPVGYRQAECACFARVVSRPRPSGSRFLFPPTLVFFFNTLCSAYPSVGGDIMLVCLVRPNNP